METNRINLMQKIPETKIKRCPSCQSIFVTEKECESCGLQLSVDIFGHPLSDRGFYSIKENYIEEQSPLARRFAIFNSKQSPRYKKYCRQLIRRFDLLAKYFNQEKPEDRKLYQIELKDLLAELIEIGYEADLLIEKLEASFNPNSFIYQTCMSQILEIHDKKIAPKKEWRLLGLFSKNSVAVLLLYVQIVILSLLLYSKALSY